MDKFRTGGAGSADEVGWMEDLDLFDEDGWGGSDVPPLPAMGSSSSSSNQTVGPGGGATIIPSSSSSSTGQPGLSMRRSFKSTLTRLSDGSGRRMRKTSRSSLLGGDNSDSSTNTTSAGRYGQPGSPSTIKNQSQAQQRGLGLGRPEVELTTGGGGGVGRKQMIGGPPKDTHFFDTVAEYSGLSIPIRIPLSIFPEEVGDVS